MSDLRNPDIKYAMKKIIIQDSMNEEAVMREVSHWVSSLIT